MPQKNSSFVENICCRSNQNSPNTPIEMVWVNRDIVAYYEIQDLMNVGLARDIAWCILMSKKIFFWKLKQPIFDQRLVLPTNKVFILKDALLAIAPVRAAAWTLPKTEAKY